ncbi:MAG: hypothetical protein ACREM6_10465 [Vulcanimicrobiaceae bacterium]
MAQGDIVVAATGVFEGDRGDVSPVSPLYFGEERVVQVWLGSTGMLPEAPSLGLRAQWGLAMVLPHACALEKEFNERVAALVAAGHPQHEAENLANDDVSLDRFIALAPLCTYDELAPERHVGVQTGARLGTFPVPANASGGIPPAWVDLRRISTTDVNLIDVEPMRLASLSPLAQAHLQAALAKHWAYRDLSRYDELQRAFGQRITAVVPISTGKKMRVGFTLEDGSQLVFDASDKPLPPANPPARRPRTSRS